MKEMAKFNEIKIESINKDPLVCIEIPGSFEDEKVIIENLGGLKEITQKIYLEESLELKLRPRDPFCIPIKSSLAPNNGILVKFRRKKSENSEISAQVMGIVFKSLRFRNLADFQVQSNSNFCGFVNSIFGKEYLDHPQTLCFGQQYLSRKSKVEMSSGRFLQDLDLEPMFQNNQSFNITSHRSIKTQTISNDIFEDKIKSPAFIHIESLFDKRPMYTRDMLHRNICENISKNILKQILQKVAYYHSSGPFKLAWCKIDVDPFVDNYYAQYQTIEMGRHIYLPHSKSLEEPDLEEKFPSKIFQYCDIDIDEIKIILKNNLTDQFHTIDGWYKPGTKESIRRILNEHTI